MNPRFDFIREWPPQDQAAGLVDLTLAFHEAMSTRGREAETQALRTPRCAPTSTF